MSLKYLQQYCPESNATLLTLITSVKNNVSFELSAPLAPAKSFPSKQKRSLELFPWEKSRTFLSPSYSLLLWGLTYFLSPFHS